LLNAGCHLDVHRRHYFLPDSLRPRAQVRNAKIPSTPEASSFGHRHRRNGYLRSVLHRVEQARTEAVCIPSALHHDSRD
jgi:hypothetical protein